MQIQIQTLKNAVLLPNVSVPLEIAWDIQITHPHGADRQARDPPTGDLNLSEAPEGTWWETRGHLM